MAFDSLGKEIVMPRFEVIGGSHEQYGREYKKGDIVESSEDLTKVFRNKFRRVDDESRMSRGTQTEGPLVMDVPPPPPPTKVAPPKVEGKDVTSRFEKAVEQDLRVFRVGKGKDAEFFVYDADNLAKPINEEGTDEEGVDVVILGFLKRG
jgi:hypothetical protein